MRRCSSCGEKPLSVRTYDCPNCGLNMDRDLNAALNLKQCGISKLKLT